MVAHKGLVWVLLGLFLIYRNNVVYCRKSSTDQYLSAHTTHLNGRPFNVQIPSTKPVQPSPHGTTPIFPSPSLYQDPRYLIANQGKLPPSPRTTLRPNTIRKQIILLLLDVNYRETTPGVILYEQEGTNTHIFSAYDPYYIKVVVQGYDLLWEAKTRPYPIGVIFYESDDQPRLDLVYEELAPVPPPPVPSYKPTVIDTLPFMPQQPTYLEPIPFTAPPPAPPPKPQPKPQPPPQLTFKPPSSPPSQQSKISQPATHQASQPRPAGPVAASQQKQEQQNHNQQPSDPQVFAPARPVFSPPRTVKPSHPTPVSGVCSATGKNASSLKLFVQDPKDSTKSIQLDQPVYAPTNLNDIRFVSYTFDEGTKCTEVTYQDSLVWKYDSTRPAVYPRSVVWHESYSPLLLQFKDHYRFYIRLSFNKRLRSRVIRTADALDICKINLYTKVGLTLKELGTDEYEFRNLEFGFEFVFVEGARCEKLTYDDKSVYTYTSDSDNTRYPKVLYVFPDTSGQVFYPGASYYLHPPYEVCLDIKTDVVPTDRFDYFAAGNEAAYVAKPGYQITRVTTRTGLCRCGRSACRICGSTVVIWDGSFSPAYATRVTLAGPGKSSKRLSVCLSDGSLRAFEKKGKNRPWNEVPVPGAS